MKLVSRISRSKNTTIKVGNILIGGKKVIVIAGPCAIESKKQFLKTAQALKKYDVDVLRAMAYKPRTSPYSFQGLEKEGLSIIKKVKKIVGLPVVTEVLDTRDVNLIAECVDILQIGARNMQNFALLKAVAKTKKPIILKRGLSAKVEEWLLAAEYILKGGNSQVILCERGIRTFETATRNTLDLNAVPLLKKLTHLPIIVDPSHGTGKKDLVIPMAKAAVACGADGLIIEVHPKPTRALSDGEQSLDLNEFKKLLRELDPIVQAINRFL